MKQHILETLRGNFHLLAGWAVVAICCGLPLCLFVGCETTRADGFDVGQYLIERGEVVGAELGVESVVSNNPELYALAIKIADTLQGVNPEAVSRDELRAEIKGLIAGQIDDMESRRWALRIVDEAGELSRVFVSIEHASEDRRALYARLAQAIRNGAANGRMLAEKGARDG